MILKRQPIIDFDAKIYKVCAWAIFFCGLSLGATRSKPVDTIETKIDTCNVCTNAAVEYEMDSKLPCRSRCVCKQTNKHTLKESQIWSFDHKIKWYTCYRMSTHYIITITVGPLNVENYWSQLDINGVQMAYSNFNERKNTEKSKHRHLGNWKMKHVVKN